MRVFLFKEKTEKKNMKDKIEHNLGLTHEILLKLVFTINSSEQKTEYKKAGVLANCWKGNKVF